MVGQDVSSRHSSSGREWGSYDSGSRRDGGRPRKRPPMRSYIPFVVFVAVCLSIMGGVLWLLVSVAQDLAGPTRTAARLAPTHQVRGPHAGAATKAPTERPTVKPHGAATVAANIGSAVTMTPVGSMLGVPSGNGVEISPGGPLPSNTPAPTATATGGSGLVVAREVDLTGKALEASSRFLSPSLRFYAVVTVHNVHSTDQLHFVFQRDGVVLPSDDIEYQAGTDADVQSFSAWADYKGGTKAFPKGQYRVLFYRNGVLEAVRKFSVG